MHSKTNLEVRLEETWAIEQGGLPDHGDGIWTKVWCPACKKEHHK